MKQHNILLALTINEWDIVCGKLRNLASSYILNGEDEKARVLLFEIIHLEGKIKEFSNHENTTI